MSNPTEEGTDGSSIQPVSSLRSHFENMLSTNQSPSVPTPRQPSPFLDKPSATDERNPRAGGRISLDLPRPSGSRHSPPRTSDFSRPGPKISGTLALQSHQNGYSKPRPISMGPLSPPRSPPLVTVNSPRSPPRPADTSTLAPAPSRDSRFNFASGGGSRNGSPTGRSFRIPSRSATPSIEARQAPFLQATATGGPSGDPKKNQERDGLTHSKSQQQHHALGIPPPINRAGKPKMLSQKPSTENHHHHLTPGNLAEVPDERVSPFSTPPSSEGSPPPESSPPAFEKNKPKGAPSRLVGPKDSYFGARSSKHADGERRVVAQPPALTKITSLKPPRHETDPHDQVEDDLPENRPGLPPRRDRAEPRITSARIPPEPPVRRSLDTQGRPSLDSLGRPGALVAETNQRFMPPPKRAQTTALVPSLGAIPRRISAEIGRGSNATGGVGSAGRYTEDSDDASEPLDKGAPLLSDFPDSSQANRRPPILRDGPREIPTKYDTKLFAVCGEYICTSGYVTRVWNVMNGEPLMNLIHGDTVKVTAISFCPAAEVEDEGKRLWLGTNTGDILDVDVPTRSVVLTKSNAHPHREIIKIYRCAGEMWSLDEDGKIHIWPSDEDGSPSLAQVPDGFRVPKGHTCSIIMGNSLWIATGKDIRVFQRSTGTQAFTQVLQRPLSQPNVGDVTSGAIIPSQPDLVYFGHADGKVTIYRRKDYTCQGVVSVSLYKISSLVGVGDYLWAGYNTGMIYVYDTTTTPWKVKKDWHAHDNMIAGIIVDRTSIWKLDRLQVASLGTNDKTLRLWDGMLQEDWLDDAMQENDAEFCDFREVSALVMTWNAGASKPSSLRHDQQDANFFRDLITAHEPPDILVFGFQELVDLEDKKVTAKSFFKSSKKKDPSEHEHMSHQYRAWKDYLMRTIDDYLPTSDPYTLLHSANLVGLFTCIFVKSSERQKIRDVSAAEVKLGMGGMHGNKGALIVRFILDDSSLCFVNCHLAAGQSQTTHRNNDIAAIMETSVFPIQRDVTTRSDMFVGGGDGSMILDHEICILNGDLNYRIDAMPRDTVVNHVKANNLAKLLERDQLLLSRKRNPGFRLRAFQESPISFAPTYKYDVGTDTYDTSEKKRSPAWCDRVLYRGLGRIKQTEYRRHEVRASDHRPVTGRFLVRVKTISPKRRLMERERCERRFEELKHRIATDIKLDYLVNLFNLSMQEAKDLLNRR